MLALGVHVGPELVSHNAFIIPHRGIRISYFARQCSPSRLVTAVLLFAEIHGGSKTKQAAPVQMVPFGEKRRQLRSRCVEMGEREIVGIKTKIISKH